MRVTKRRLGQRASKQLNDRHLSVSVIPCLIMQTGSQLLLFHSRSDLHPGDRRAVQEGHCLLQHVLTSHSSCHRHQCQQCSFRELVRVVLLPLYHYCLLHFLWIYDLLMEQVKIMQHSYAGTELLLERSSKYTFSILNFLCW